MPLPEPPDAVDARVVKALSHPTRVRILELLQERELASPVELAGELGIPLGTVSYHVRRLEQLGFIELATRTQRRGAIEHHYRARAALDTPRRRRARRAAAADGSAPRRSPHGCSTTPTARSRAAASTPSRRVPTLARCGSTSAAAASSRTLLERWARRLDADRAGEPPAGSPPANGSAAGSRDATTVVLLFDLDD